MEGTFNVTFSEGRARYKIEDFEEYHIKSYITCFSLLFEDDFDEQGKILEKTVERLKLQQKDSNQNNRPFVTANYKIFDQDIKILSRQRTPRFVNRWLSSPVKDKNIAQIYGGRNYVEGIRKKIDATISSKEMTEKAMNQLLHDRDIDDKVKEELYNSDITKDFNLFGNHPEEFVFHGGCVLYSDNFNPFTDEGNRIIAEKDRLNELSENEAYKLKEKIIECCLSLKKEKYSEQREYRLFISNFYKRQDFDGIKLISSDNLHLKKYNGDQLCSITRRDFISNFEDWIR